MNNNPHVLVKFSIECIAVLLEEKTDWDHCKKHILRDTNLLNKLKNINCDALPNAVKEKFKKKCKF